MPEVAENILVLNVEQVKKSLIETNSLQTKLNENIKQAGEVSKTAFSGKAVESYSDRLRRLNDELKGQENIIKQIKQAEIELQAQNKKLSNDQKVDLKAAQQIQKDIKKEIQETTTAQKNYEKELKNTHTTAKAAAETFKHLGQIIIAAFSVEKIFEFLKESNKMYLEAQRNEHMLAVSLKDREHLTSVLIGYAKQLQSNSIIPKDQIIAQEQYLAALDLSEQMIKKIIQTAADWNATDQTVSFESAVKSLTATVTRGSIEKGIAKVIGKHKELTEEQIKGGAAIDLFAEKFKNAALSLSQTDFGTLEKQKNQIRELREELGKTITQSGIEKLWLNAQRNAIAGAAGTIANWRNIFKTGNEKMMADAEVIFNFTKTESGKYVSDVVQVFDAIDFKEIKKNIDQVRANFILTFVREGEKNKDAADLWDMYFARRLKTANEFNNKIEIPLKEQNKKQGEYLDQLLEYNKKRKKEIDEWEKEQREKAIEKQKQDAKVEIDIANQTAQAIQDINRNKWLVIAKQMDEYIEKMKSDAGITLETQQKTTEQLKILAEQETQDKITEAQKIVAVKEQQYQREIQGAQSVFNSLSYLSTAAMGLAKENTDLTKVLSYANIIFKEAEALAGGIALVSSSSKTWYEALSGYVTIIASVVGAFSEVYSVYDSAPAFAEGVIDLKLGKNKRGKDTIPAMLDEGESVMTAEETRANKPLLEAIRNGKRDEYIRTNFVIPVLNKELLQKVGKTKTDTVLESILANGINAKLNDYDILRRLKDVIESNDRNANKIIRALTKKQIRR